MNFQTSERIDAFNFHDSPLIEIRRNGGGITLFVEFAFIHRDHPANPSPLAQCIKPCSVKFIDVSDDSAKLWSEAAREHVAHPAPDRPLGQEILEFECTDLGKRFRTRISGFHEAGWSEWTIYCREIEVSWDRFSGKAWFEGWPGATTGA